ncbi:SDR family oxidoreductase [Shewanella acanthi]|uniref:SDR family oxidoreductase n=1 Tax=Shewanella acanthi TaxID=2864212 RepID=UPI001C65AA48|nr:sugar nucleotide-binding protein [Shewanella acanthi]QYJ77795.1 NAD(P)-dependent oxidoreductase [Shewanella acanthi]
MSNSVIPKACHASVNNQLPQTVLITAADSQLAKALLSTHASLFTSTLTHQNTGSPVRMIALSHTQLDITDEESIAQAFKQYAPNAVINCAAYNAVDKAEDDREMADKVNAFGPELLAKMCQKQGARLVHISSDYVFNGGYVFNSDCVFKGDGVSDGDCVVDGGNVRDGINSTHRPYRETDIARPLSVYGQSKLDGEKAVLTLLPDDAIVVRTAWLFGVDGTNFVKTMLKLMATKPKLEVINDQLGSPTWSYALAMVIWQLLLTRQSGLFHYAGAGQCSWFEFACEIQRQALSLGLLTRQVPILPITSADYNAQAIAQGRRLATRPNYSVLNSYKTKALLDVALASNEGNLVPFTNEVPLWQDWRLQLQTMLEAYQDTTIG